MQKLLGTIGMTKASERNGCKCSVSSSVYRTNIEVIVNALNAKFTPICHFAAVLGAHHILHVSRIRVNMIYATQMKLREKERSFGNFHGFEFQTGESPYITTSD
jgi:hypothetical protein